MVDIELHEPCVIMTHDSSQDYHWALHAHTKQKQNIRSTYRFISVFTKTYM
jgi:hypothetical protein